MSNTLALELPVFSPHEAPHHPRHIEIVSTRSQKRARPRVVYALVAVAGLFVILVAQLLLSIWLSNGAYQISALQQSQRELARDQQTLNESLNVLQSPQNLAGRASELGMVLNTGSQGFLSLTGGVSRSPSAATADTTVPTAAAALTPNSLITPDVSGLGADGAAGNPAAAGAPSTPGADGSVTSTTGAAAPAAQPVLPSPVTH